MKIIGPKADICLTTREISNCTRCNFCKIRLFVSNHAEQMLVIIKLSSNNVERIVYFENKMYNTPIFVIEYHGIPYQKPFVNHINELRTIFVYNFVQGQYIKSLKYFLSGNWMLKLYF